MSQLGFKTMEPNGWALCWDDESRVTKKKGSSSMICDRSAERRLSSLPSSTLRISRRWMTSSDGIPKSFRQIQFILVALLLSASALLLVAFCDQLSGVAHQESGTIRIEIVAQKKGVCRDQVCIPLQLTTVTSSPPAGRSCARTSAVCSCGPVTH